MDEDLTNLSWLRSTVPLMTAFSENTQKTTTTDTSNIIAKRSHPVALKRKSKPTNDNSKKKLQIHQKTNFNQLEKDHKRLMLKRDLKSDKNYKPPFSYAAMICLAMRNVNSKMTLDQIYKWIEDNFAYYKYGDKGWKNSIRHNLSQNKCFVKIQRPKSKPGKGGYWVLNPKYQDNVEHNNQLKNNDNQDIIDEIVKQTTMDLDLTNDIFPNPVPIVANTNNQSISNENSKQNLPFTDATPAIKLALEKLHQEMEHEIDNNNQVKIDNESSVVPMAAPYLMNTNNQEEEMKTTFTNNDQQIFQLASDETISSSLDVLLYSPADQQQQQQQQSQQIVDQSNQQQLEQYLQPTNIEVQQQSVVINNNTEFLPTQDDPDKTLLTLTTADQSNTNWENAISLLPPLETALNLEGLILDWDTLVTDFK